eukprot:snap_masked-scaffold_7-processed-gene-9.21-mRNA-1 protein AED:0.12 eAED:0.12 QI:0/-1/0/1/-1/1/1/0/558
MQLTFLAYGLLSTTSATLIILYAYAIRFQFYSTVLHLTSSKFSVLVLSNFFIFLVLSLGRFSNWIFFGSLRQTERELLWENSGYAITETCLALTIFRDQLNLYVGILFVMLLFVKIFHWLLTSRVEYLEQTEEVSKLQHIRIISLLIILFFIDSLFSYVAISDVIKAGEPSVNLLFGFEFVLLTLSLISTILKYGLYSVSHLFTENEASRWHNKSVYELYSKLILSIIRLAVYSCFFAIVFSYYGLPIHLLRQLFLSYKAVKQRLFHFIQFRRVSQALRYRFPDATEEELNATDKVCIICRENMEISGQESIKKLNCGHLFHFYCLRNWFERQLKCPTCRSDILEQLQTIETRDRRVNTQANSPPMEPNNHPEQAQPPPPPPPRQPRQRFNLFDRRVNHPRGIPVVRAVPQEVAVDDSTAPTPPAETSAQSVNQGIPDVNAYLENQIDLISVQLELYSTQLRLADEAKEASKRLLELSKSKTEEPSKTFFSEAINENEHVDTDTSNCERSQQDKDSVISLNAQRGYSSSDTSNSDDETVIIRPARTKNAETVQGLQID